MKRELAEEAFALTKARSKTNPASMEFEMAYQARVAIDRIRFAIKHTEQFGPKTDQMQEVGFQLLDALERLEGVDRRFQARSRIWIESEVRDNHATRAALRQSEAGPQQQPNGRDARQGSGPKDPV